MSGAQSASPLREGRLEQFDGCCMEILKFVAFIYTSVAALNCTFPAGHFLPLSCLSLHILSFHILSPLKHSLPLQNSLHSPVPLWTESAFQGSLQACRDAVHGVNYATPGFHSTSLNVPKLMPILIYFVFIQFNGAMVPKIYMEKYKFPFPSWVCTLKCSSSSWLQTITEGHFNLLVILKTMK